MKPFYIETGMGACIRMASSLEAAKRAVLKEVGTIHGVSLAREATTRDILHLKMMCGMIPPGAEAYIAQRAKENQDAI